MNYEQARALGAESNAPGKWNWTNRHDGLIYTIAPCRRLDDERCDHDTREEAERHYHAAALALVTFDTLRIDAPRLSRCEFRPCGKWETHYANWHEEGRINHLCDDHANLAALDEVWPFAPGMSVVHS